MKTLLTALAGLLVVGSTAAAGTYRIDRIQPNLPVTTPIVYNPGAVYTYSPVTPTVTYFAPPVVAYPAPAPVVVYRPGVYVAPAPVYYPARQVLIRPKVYVRGQPVRNVLRAVTP